MAASIPGPAKLLRAAQTEADDLKELDILIVASPTQGGRPTSPVSTLLKQIPAGALDRTKVAAFDTRLAKQKQVVGLRVLMSLIGFAAPRIAVALQHKGGRLVVPPEGFIVEDKEGPLASGELERATAWARSIVSA
jgi:flavodoxin I